MIEHNIEGAYGYFMGANHGKSYEECLDSVKKYHAKRRKSLLDAICVPFTASKIKNDRWDICSSPSIRDYIEERGPVYDWQFTLSGATNTAIAKVLKKQKAFYALEQLIAPLEFASKCGLPKAIKPEEFIPIRQNAEAWIEDGMKWDSPFNKHLNQEIRITIFNAGVNLHHAMKVLDKLVYEEWAKISGVDNTIVSHLSDLVITKHLSEVVEIKAVLDRVHVKSYICLHNLIVKTSNDNDEHPSTVTSDKYTCPICIQR